MAATVSYQTRQRTKQTEIPQNTDNGKEAKEEKKGAPKTEVELIHEARMKDANKSSRANFTPVADRVIAAAHSSYPI